MTDACLRVLQVCGVAVDADPLPRRKGSDEEDSREFGALHSSVLCTPQGDSLARESIDSRLHSLWGLKGKMWCRMVKAL